MAYVDLNPIRAGIAATPDAQDVRIEHGEKAGWLAPVNGGEKPWRSHVDLPADQDPVGR